MSRPEATLESLVRAARPRRNLRTAGLVALLVLVGVLVRSPIPNIRPMWDDEAYSVLVARSSLPEVIRVGFDVDSHPPGYYLLLHFWRKAFGDSLRSIRALSNIVVAAGILIAAFSTAALLGRRTGWLAALLLTASPYLARMDEARDHCLMFLAGSLALAIIAWAERWRTIRPWIAAGALCVAALYSSYCAIQIVIGLGAALLWLYRGHLRTALGGAAVAGAMLLISLPPLLRGLRAAKGWGDYYIHHDPWGELLPWGVRRAVTSGAGLLVSYGHTHELWIDGAAALAVLACLVGLLGRYGIGAGGRGSAIRTGETPVSPGQRPVLPDQRSASPGETVPALLLFTTLGWVFWSGWTIANRTLLMNSSYLAAVAAPLYALLALGLASMSSRRLRIATICLLGIAFTGGYSLLHRDRTEQTDWPALLAFIKARERPSDAIAIIPPYAQLQAYIHHTGRAALIGIPVDYDLLHHRATMPEHQMDRDKLPAVLKRLSQFRRVWLIETRMGTADPERLTYGLLAHVGRIADLGVSAQPGRLKGELTLFELAAAASPPSSSPRGSGSGRR